MRISRAVLACMSGIGPAAVFVGIFMTVTPFSFLLRLLQRLPPPIVLSHKRWPLALNTLITLGVTLVIVLFLHRAADRSHDLSQTALEFVIAAVVYSFGLVLVLRQFCGAYEDFIITVGGAGLALQKTSYSNIVKAEGENSGADETEIRIETSKGTHLTLILPTQSVERFYTHIRKKRSIE
jgi:hypothetical protein